MTTYNGWANYPTWAVHLWLSNDEGSYEEARMIANGSGSPLEREQKLRDCVLDYHIIELTGSLSSDLLGYAARQIDWSEILDAFLDEDENEWPDDEQAW